MLSEAVAQESTGDIGFYYVDKKRAKSILKSSKVQYLSVLDSLNSNGIIHKIDEKVNRKIDSVLKSKQFIRWFGDWQNKPETASKIVNADGTPKVMYHGTQSSFTAFDKKKAKSSGYYGKGFYFTESESHAKQYGDSMAVYLDVKNPLEPGKNSISKKQLRKFLEAVAENEDYDIWNYGTEDISEIVDSIYKNDAFSVIQDINATAIGDFAEAIALFNKVNKTSYDGIVTPTETVVYEPIQIKSATDNIGTFDSNNDDIRFSSKRAETTAKNPNRLTENDVKRFMEDAINGNLHEGTYFPVRRNTPKILIESALNKNGDTIENLPIIIQVKKATAHGISSEDMIAIVKAMDDPQYIIYQEDNDRYVEVVKYDTSKGSKAVAVLEIGGNKDTPYLNGFEGGSYHTLVTAFKPDAGYVSDTLLNKKSNTVIYKKKGNSQRTSGSTVPSVLNELPFADSISENGNNVNGDNKFSTKRDTDYMTAVESGDTETAQKLVYEAAEKAMPDSIIRDNNGKLLTVYHGSPSKFTVFNHNKMNVNGNAHGRGFYFTEEKSMAEGYQKDGGQLLKGYLNITNPMSEEKVTIKKSDLVKLIKATCEEEARNLVSDGGYEAVSDALPDTWISNYVYTYGMSLDRAYREVADIIYSSDNDVDIIAEISNVVGAEIALKNACKITGYDGVVYTNERGTHEYVALVSNQFKSSDPITYDDKGNVIPLSQRFDDSKDDIRFATKRYWKPNMPKADLDTIKKMAKNELFKTDNYLDNITKWLYNSKNGKTYFALYSTEVESDPTILYASIDDQAVAEHSFVRSYLNELGDESDDGKAKTFNEILEMLENSGDLRTVYRGMSSNRRNGNGDVSVYSRPSSSGISRALLNCLQDCYERRRSVEEKQKFSTKRQSSVSEDASDYILDTKEYKEAMKLVDQRYRLTGKKKLDAKAIDRFAGRLLSKSQSQYSREQLNERLSALFDYIANSGTVIKKGLAHII